MWNAAQAYRMLRLRRRWRRSVAIAGASELGADDAAFGVLRRRVPATLTVFNASPSRGAPVGDGSYAHVRSAGRPAGCRHVDGSGTRQRHGGLSRPSSKRE